MYATDQRTSSPLQGLCFASIAIFISLPWTVWAWLKPIPRQLKTRGESGIRKVLGRGRVFCVGDRAAGEGILYNIGLCALAIGDSFAGRLVFYGPVACRILLTPDPGALGGVFPVGRI